MYGKPRLGESTLTEIVLDTSNLAQINFSVLGTFMGSASEEKNTLYISNYWRLTSELSTGEQSAKNLTWTSKKVFYLQDR